MFHRGFPRNRRFYGPHHFMRNHQMGMMPMGMMPMGPRPMGMMPMPMPLPPAPPIGPPVDPEFLRHTQSLPSINWCENAICRVKGAQPDNVPVMAISKKLSKTRRKSKEERMAKEARKKRKQERKLKLESIFLKSPTPERPKPSTSKDKSEQPEKVSSGKDTEKKSNIGKKSNKKSEESSDAKKEKKSGDRTVKRTKKNRKKKSSESELNKEKSEKNLQQPEEVEMLKLEKSPPLEIKRNKSPEDKSEKKATKKHDKTPEIPPHTEKKYEQDLKKTEKKREIEPEKEKKHEKKVEKHEKKIEKHEKKVEKHEKKIEKHSDKQLDKKEEKPVEKERATSKKSEIPCGNKLQEKVDKKVEKASENKMEKSAEKKMEKPSEKKMEKASEKKLEKSSEKKVDKPSEKKVDKPSEKKVEKSSEKKVEKFSGKKDEKSSERKVEKSSEKKIEKPPSDKKVDKSSEKKLEKSTEKKVDKSSEKKIEKSTEKKVEKFSERKVEKLSEKKVEKHSEKKSEKPLEKKVDKNSEKRRDKLSETKSDKSFEKKFEKSSAKKSEKHSEKKSPDKKSDKRSKSKSRPKFGTPVERDSRSITPVIFDISEVPASPKIEIDETSEIYKQDEVDEPQTPPIIEALSKPDGSEKKLSIFDRSPVEDSPKLDESLLGAEMLKLNLENKLRELDAEEDEEMEEEQKLELDIFSEDSPKATEAMKTIWSIHPDHFNVPIKMNHASLYDDDILSPKPEPKKTEIKGDIDQVIIPVKSEDTVHVINSLENLQVCYGEEDDEDVEMPLPTPALLKLQSGEWDDEFSNSSYTKLCDEIEKHKNKMQEKGHKEVQKEIQKPDDVKESRNEFGIEVKKEVENEQVGESEVVALEPKKELEQGIEPKQSILNTEYEAFIKLLDESDTSEKKPSIDRHSRSQSNSSNSSSRSSSSSSSSSASSSSSSSSSSNSSDSSSSSSSSGSTSSSASESSPQFEENDVLKRALEKIMEIIPENYDGADRNRFNPEDLKNEILKILQSDANLNKKMQNVENEPEAPKIEQPKLSQSILEPGQSKIWNISTDSDEILMASPVKKLTKPKSPERSSKRSSSAERKSRKQSLDFRSEKRSSSREKYRKQRSRDRSRDYYDDRRHSSRNRSKSPRRRKSRSPAIKERSRKSPPPEPRISPKSKWSDNVSYLEDSSYISNYGFRPPSPKEPPHPESEFQYNEISSSSWNSEPSNQYCAYPPAHADTSPQRISLDERIDMALGISNNDAHHPSYYNYPSERYPPHNEAYNTPIYNQYYHQYKAVPPAMAAYPVPPPPIHHNYYPPTYAAHQSPISVVQHQNSPFLHRNISTPPIHHQPSPQPSQKASFAVQVGNVLEIIPSELPSQSIEIPKPPVEKHLPANISQSSASQQPSSSVSKTAEQIISEAVDQRKQQRDQKRFGKKLRKEKLKLEISKLINLSNTMKIADSIAANVEAESDSNEVSTTFESTSDAIPLGKPERGILRQGEKTVATARKKVMFHDGIEPGNGTSTTDDEIIPPEKMKKKKKRRYSSNKENIALINQLLGTTRENSMNPEKPPDQPQTAEPEEYEDKLPPPPPPTGSPPPNCLQPKLKNPPAPEYLYFHLNPNENRLILTPYRPQIFQMQSCFAQLQQLMSQPNQRPTTTKVQSQPSLSLPFSIPSHLDGLLSDPRFANAINALSNSLPLLRRSVAAEPKIDAKVATPSTSAVGSGRDEASKKTGTRTNL